MNHTLKQLVDHLADRPVAGYTARQKPASEVVALTAIALTAHGREKEARIATDWLAEQQAEDGSLAVRRGLSGPGWPTSLAVLAWQAVESHESNIDRATNSLLKKWKEGGRSKFSDYDFREKTIVSPKIGPDPDFFNRLLSGCCKPKANRCPKVDTVRTIRR